MNDLESEQRVSVLIEALADEKVSVGWNAARDLAKLGPAASLALPALSQALKSSDATTTDSGIATDSAAPACSRTAFHPRR